ncbi:MAG: glycosyltransferase family 4 protein [Candidatus Marinimicrobia bacterium]|nr:glycosyltransferase family 4 protein [Candidatus Neomarinimicrobiota bacterium]
MSKRANSDNPLKILFLAHFYPPEMGGAAARISGLAGWFHKLGNDVTVITGFPNYPGGQIYKGYTPGLLRKEILDAVTIIRTWVYFTRKKSPVLRILNYISFMVSSVIAGIKLKNQFDIIIVSSPPLFIGISGWLLSKIWHTPWIFDIRDIWPDVAVEAGEYKESALIVRIGSLVTKLIYNSANHLTPVTESKCKKIIEQGIDKNKISIVPNGIDMQYISFDDQIDWRKELNLQNKFIFIYAGLIGIAQGLDIIIESASNLTENDEIHFLIVGDGVQKKQLQLRAKQLNLSNITFLNSQKRENIAPLLKTSDVAVIPLVNAAISDAVPSKLLEAWGCKKPVILIASGESNMIVKNVDGGLTVNPGDIPGLVKNILDMYQNKSRLQHYGNNGYKYVTKSFTREILARQMVNVIKKYVLTDASITKVMP